MEQPPMGIVPKKKSVWRFAPLLVLLLAVGGFFAYQAFGASQLTRALPEGDVTIAFSDTGVMEKFLISHYSLLAQPKSHAGEAVILESAPLLDATEHAVLASVPNTLGTVLGIMHGNGNFEPILSDGTQKTDLHVISGSLVVYTVLMNPVVWEGENATLNSAEDADDPATIVEGHATGPVDSGVDYKNAAAGNQTASVPRGALYAFRMGTDTSPRALGAGKSPRLLSDGSLVAIAPEGVVKIELSTGSRTVLLSYPGGDDIGSTISADGSMALLRTKGNSVMDVYTITGGEAKSDGSIVSMVPVFGATFADNERIFLRTGKTNVALYKIPDDTASLKPPTAHLSIIAPQ